MATITPKDVAHVAKLSRIALATDEIEKFTNELGAILGYVAKLQEARPPARQVKEGKESLAFITGLQNVWEDDVVRSCDIARNALLANAPDQQDGFIKVKAILE